MRWQELQREPHPHLVLVEPLSGKKRGPYAASFDEVRYRDHLGGERHRLERGRTVYPYKRRFLEATAHLHAVDLLYAMHGLVRGIFGALSPYLAESRSPIDSPAVGETVRVRRRVLPNVLFLPPITPNGVVRPRLLYSVEEAMNIDGTLFFYSYEETEIPKELPSNPAWDALLKSASLMAQTLIPIVHEYGE